MSVFAYHFWSPTCGPCTFIKPAIEDLKEEFSNVQWVPVNTQNDTNGYAQKFGVQVVPTIVVVVLDSTGKAIYSEKQSGTNVAGYYRILRGGLKFVTKV
jgi:thiol-disulfide isomerase/thioredoxin